MLQPVLELFRVSGLQGLHALPKPTAELADGPRKTAAPWAQHPGAGHRGEAERIQGGEQDRSADGQGDRLIEASDRSRNEQHREEHGCQHQ